MSNTFNEHLARQLTYERSLGSSAWVNTTPVKPTRSTMRPMPRRLSGRRTAAQLDLAS